MKIKLGLIFGLLMSYNINAETELKYQDPLEKFNKDFTIFNVNDYDVKVKMELKKYLNAIAKISNINFKTRNCNDKLSEKIFIPKTMKTMDRIRDLDFNHFTKKEQFIFYIDENRLELNCEREL